MPRTCSIRPVGPAGDASAGTLCAYLSDGTVVCGETEIDRPGGRPVVPIERVYLDPPVTVLPQVRKALTRADKILIGPGDLYTSIVPCLLVDGVPDAIQSSDGEVIYICNVMTKHGETDGFRASDFVRVIHRYLGRRVDTVIVNTATPSTELAERYASEGAEMVALISRRCGPWFRRCARTGLPSLIRLCGTTPSAWCSGSGPI